MDAEKARSEISAALVESVEIIEGSSKRTPSMAYFRIARAIRRLEGLIEAEEGRRSLDFVRRNHGAISDPTEGLLKQPEWSVFDDSYIDGNDIKSVIESIRAEVDAVKYDNEEVFSLSELASVAIRAHIKTRTYGWDAASRVMQIFSEMIGTTPSELYESNPAWTFSPKKEQEIRKEFKDALMHRNIDTNTWAAANNRSIVEKMARSMCFVNNVQGHGNCLCEGSCQGGSSVKDGYGYWLPYAEANALDLQDNDPEKNPVKVF